MAAVLLVVMVSSSQSLAYDSTNDYDITSSQYLQNTQYTYFQLYETSSAAAGSTWDYSTSTVYSDLYYEINVSNPYEDYTDSTVGDSLGTYDSFYGSVLVEHPSYTITNDDRTIYTAWARTVEPISASTNIGFPVDVTVSNKANHTSSSVNFTISGNNLPKTFVIRFQVRVYYTFFNNYSAASVNSIVQSKPTLTVSLESFNYRVFGLSNIDRSQSEIHNAIVEDHEAGDTIDSASGDFNDSSAQLMAQEDALNADADANVDAVDLDQLDLLGTYSQSMSFWMALVASLPAAVGSIWEVLVFGFLIAFLLFILRLVR